MKNKSCDEMESHQLRCDEPKPRKISCVGGVDCLLIQRCRLISTQPLMLLSGLGGPAAPQSVLKEIKLTVISYSACKAVYETSLPVSGVFCASPVTAGDDTCLVSI